MRSLLWVLGAVVAMSCSSSARPGAGPVTAPAAADLPPALTAPRGTLLFGDLHGTRELPAFVAHVTRALAATQPVVLALEVRADEAPSIPAFLASDGGPAARAALLRDAWWQSAYQDGRRSVAMVELLDTARRLRASGARVDVACFDAARPPDGVIDAAEREASMAHTLIALRAARPDAAFVVYAGNLHTIRKGVDFQPGFDWMAMRLAQAGISFITLNARYRDGTAWLSHGATPESCGIDQVHGIPGEPGVHLEASADGNYDGWYDVGPITASPPAAFPERGAAAP